MSIKLFKLNKEQTIDKSYEDNGVFLFQEKGFSIKTIDGLNEVEWVNINSMIGYKEDRFTTDNICLDIFTNSGKCYKISEETAGWPGFLEHSKGAFPTIKKDWAVEISIPPFEKNMTLVYDRQNRDLNDVIKDNYKL